MTTATQAPATLQDYREHGFAGPLTMMSPAEMEQVAEEVRRVLATDGPAPDPDPVEQLGRLSSLISAPGRSAVPRIECRHLDSPTIWRLCSHPALLEVARALYGPDLLLWRSTLIEKRAGGPEFKLHQDWGGVHRRGTEYGLEPPLSFTAWIAITESTVENGCLHFIRNVRAVLPTTAPADQPNATGLIPEGLLDTTAAEPMELEPGQFVVFTDRAPHFSTSNVSSDRPRLGLAVRMTVPCVKVRPHFPGHRPVLLSGLDRVGLNELASPAVA